MGAGVRGWIGTTLSPARRSRRPKLYVASEFDCVGGALHLGPGEACDPGWRALGAIGAAEEAEPLVSGSAVAAVRVQDGVTSSFIRSRGEHCFIFNYLVTLCLAPCPCRPHYAAAP
jgi:hypothetical protein